MSVSEVLIIFHYDGDFQFDIIRPVYNRENKKMRYLPTDITYESLVKKAIEASNWDSSIQRLSIQYLYHNGQAFSMARIDDLSIQYLHHNGRAFSMARIDDDNDVKRMLKASGNDVNGIYLYVFNGLKNKRCVGGEQWRYVHMLYR